MIKADFHVHSTFSDGSFSREAILDAAKEKGVTHIAFTDHDTTKDYEKAVALGKAYGIKVVPGIEISAFDDKEGKKVHIVGLNYKNVTPLEALCRPILKRRHNNCLKQIEILHTLGYNISPIDIQSYATDTFYKQHILAWLLDSGQEQEMFGHIYRTIFKNGGKCDFDIDYVAAEDAVKAVKESGGIAILAHPGQQNNFSIIPRLVEAGLDGIEINHPSHNSKMRQIVREMSKQYGLLLSGGSDFHGRYEKKSAEIGEYIVPEDSDIFNRI